MADVFSSYSLLKVPVKCQGCHFLTQDLECGNESSFLLCFHDLGWGERDTEMLVCLSYPPLPLRAIGTIQVFTSLAWLETDLKVLQRDHSLPFLPRLYNIVWSLQKPFGTTTDVTDPSLIIHNDVHTMHYPQNWIQKCWTSCPASDALWHQWKSHLFSSPCEISPCLLAGWLMLCHHNVEPEACCLLWPGDFWPWTHPLSQLNEKEKEYKVCVWGVRPNLGPSSMTRHLPWNSVSYMTKESEREGQKKGPGGKAERNELHP